MKGKYTMSELASPPSSYSQDDLPTYVQAMASVSDTALLISTPYGSVISSVSEVINSRMSSKHSMKFSCHRCVKIGYTLFVAFIKLLISLIYPAYYAFCIGWGVKYLHAECENMLAIWLIVYGCVYLLSVVKSTHDNLKYKGKTNEEIQKEVSAGYRCFSLILECFNFAWFITGAVWVYRMHIHGDYLCVAPLFNMVFWSITVTFIIAASAVGLLVLYLLLLLLIVILSLIFG